MRRWSSARSATATPCCRTPARARRRHGDALRRLHHRARVGARAAQVLRQQHLLDAHAARVLRGGGGAALRVLLHGRGLRHPGRRRRRGDTPTAPINPYGTSKLMSEWMLRDVAAGDAADATSALRYFNVAGSDPTAASARRRRTRRCSSRWPARRPSASARMCRSSAPTTRRPTAPAYATTSTWRTSPRAHLDALDLPARRRRLHHAQRRLRARLQRARGARERRARGRRAAHGARGAAPRRRSRRRSWHAPSASARELGWQPRLDDLDTIVRSAYAWEQRLLREPW